MTSRLPKYLRLSGADTADTNAQLLAALKFAYRRILASEDFVDRVEKLQGASEAARAGEIDDLCVLIEQRQGASVVIAYDEPDTCLDYARQR